MNYDYYSFDPLTIKPQWEAMQKYYQCEDELIMMLMHGTLGSAKSALCAWLILDHCVEFSNAKACYGRRSMQDLRKSAFSEIESLVIKTWGHEHDVTKWINYTNKSFEFPWGATIESVTWGDGKFDKFKSQNYSMLWLEEGTENDNEDFEQLATYLFPRIGRINKNNSNVQRNAIIISTNPDSPDHYLYKYFIEKKLGLEQFSHMRDNPFLPSNYYERLKDTMTHAMLKRNGDGEWNYATSGEAIYYAYSEANNIQEYIPDRSLPLRITFDFNATNDKPMSCLIGQVKDKKLYCFDEILITNGKTIQVMQELDNRGYLKDWKVWIYGDASGVHKDTRTFSNDFEIIKDYMRSKGYWFELDVMKANPLIKARHNAVNTLLLNAKNESKILITDKCQVLRRGLRDTRFKKGTSIEDDNNAYQHITTALGYMAYLFLIREMLK